MFQNNQRCIFNKECFSSIFKPLLDLLPLNLTISLGSSSQIATTTEADIAKTASPIDIRTSVTELASTIV